MHWITDPLITGKKLISKHTAAESTLNESEPDTLTLLTVGNGIAK